MVDILNVGTNAAWSHARMSKSLSPSRFFIVTLDEYQTPKKDDNGMFRPGVRRRCIIKAPNIGSALANVPSLATNGSDPISVQRAGPAVTSLLEMLTDPATRIS